MTGDDRPAGEVTGQDAQRVRGVFERAKNEGMEGLFYCTFLIAAVEGGLILWDLFTMMPWFARLAGLAGPNTLVASIDMSNVYLGFLTAYCGGKEAKRWLSRAAAAEPGGELEAQVQRFSRGTAIVFGWQALLVMAVVIRDLHLVPRLPNELFRVAMQSLALWTGTYVSGRAHQVRMKRKNQGEPVDIEIRQGDDKAVRISDAHRQMVLEFLKTNSWITREKCEAITGLGIWQAHRLLTGMEENGLLEGDGVTKGRKYRRKETSRPENRLNNRLNAPESPK
jgi:hypothetical protein